MHFASGRTQHKQSTWQPVKNIIHKKNLLRSMLYGSQAKGTVDTKTAQCLWLLLLSCCWTLSGRSHTTLQSAALEATAGSSWEAAGQVSESAEGIKTETVRLRN